MKGRFYMRLWSRKQFLLLFFSFFCVISVCRAAEYEEVIMDGTVYKTAVYIRTVPENPRPAVLITGGVHGSEPAGAAAAEKMRAVEIKAGTLIVVPRVNNLALKANRRTLPEIEDVNRAYPGRKNGTPAERIAFEITGLIRRYNVSVVIDMHEALDFTYMDKRSLGQSILPAVNPQSRALAEKAIAYINTTLQKPHEKFVVKRSGPVAGSTAFSAGSPFQRRRFHSGNKQKTAAERTDQAACDDS
ncbi:MAG: succinylglutamate desuccinylase/aspartoacylase family protein [Acidaminococcales bacterium]|jgi:predicted deacylase|nr:succinylglutamate desuccinylase/aspartoacylase family protein [Acidaminococcales bacterium]